jgi:sporulation protein YlmC with PRC-barrel domain
MRNFATASIIAIMAVSPALAQSTPPATPTPPPAAAPDTTTRPSSSATTTTTTTTTGVITFVPTQSSEQMLSTNVVGQSVYGTNGEKVGDINNLLFDNKGMVVAAVIGVGGFLGIGEKDVGVPFSAIKWQKNRDRDEMHIDATKDQLKNAPTFERYRVPASANTGAGSATTPGTRAPATP